MPKVVNSKNPLWRYAITGWHEGDKALTKDQVIAILKEHGKKWVFQHELTQEGKHHWQGRVSLKKPIRLSKAIKLLKPLHVSIEHEEEASSFYSMKQERQDGPWTDKDQTLYVPRFQREMKLNEVQTWIWNRLQSQDRRKILFIVDKKGNNGKTELRKWLATTQQAINIPSTMSKPEDVMNMVYAKVHTNPEKTYYVVLDIPKSVMKDEMWNKWMASVETIKDGHAYDKRYTWKEQYFETPKILVFANKKPPKYLLSKDRFDVNKMDWIKFSCGIYSRDEYEAIKAAEKAKRKDVTADNE